VQDSRHLETCRLAIASGKRRSGRPKHRPLRPRCSHTQGCHFSNTTGDCRPV